MVDGLPKGDFAVLENRSDVVLAKIAVVFGDDGLAVLERSFNQTKFARIVLPRRDGKNFDDCATGLVDEMSAETSRSGIES